MDKKTIIALALSALFAAAWQKLYIEPRMPKTPVSQTTAASTTASGTTPTAEAVPSERAEDSLDSAASPSVPEELLVASVASGEVGVSSGKRWISSWKLNSFRASQTEGAGPVDLNHVVFDSSAVEVDFNRKDFLYLKGVTGKVTKKGKDFAEFSYQDKKVSILRTVRWDKAEGFLTVDVTAKFPDPNTAPEFAFISLRSQSPSDDPEKVDRQLAYYTDGSVSRVQLGDSVSQTQITTAVRWIAALDRYFMLAVVSGEGEQPSARVQPVGEMKGWIGLVYPVRNAEWKTSVRVYFGPKDVDLLAQVDPTLSEAIDLGFASIVAVPMLRLLQLLHRYALNWGIAIILLTLLVKAATFPLTFKSMQSMRKMAVLQPELKKLQEKYKDDKEALNREMMLFMRNKGYNPLSGCLPMLVQIPIFLALYRVLYSSVELYQAPFFGWIHDLSQKDPFYVTPLILTAVMYFQQRLTPSTATDPMQQKMLQYMPVVFGLIMLNLPSGLTLYMLVNAVTSIAQQLVLNRTLGPIHGAKTAKAT